MFYKRSPSKARNEFVEPPPQDQSSALLIVGEQRIHCRLTEVSIGGFCVVVPRATRWAGEPEARLLTNDSSYDVRILKQTAQYDGFEVRLQRVEETAPTSLTGTQRWIIYGSRCCAIGLVLGIAYCIVAAPGGESRGPAHPVSFQDIVNYWLDFRPKAAEKPSDQNRPVPVERVSERDHIDDMPAISVSLGSETSVAGPNEAPSNAVLDRVALVKQAALAASSGRSRPVNSTTLPWLFANSKSANPPFRCRMTHLAEEDLRVFENCLKSLSASGADDAIQSLRSALSRTSGKSFVPVAGVPNVRMVESDDAEVYFRMVDGEAELLRVLPGGGPQLRGRSAHAPHESYR